MKPCEWCEQAPAVSRFCSAPCYRAWNAGATHAYPADRRAYRPGHVPGELLHCWRELLAVMDALQAQRRPVGREVAA